MMIVLLVLAMTSVVASEAFAQEGSPTTIVITRDGNRYAGSVLYASDSVLVLWRSSDPYHSSTLRLHGTMLRVSEIDSIIVEREGDGWLGAAKGFVGGFVIGVGIGLVIDGGHVDVEIDSLHFHPPDESPHAGILGIALAIPGALIFGIQGALEGVDDDYVIGGNSEAYRTILSTLQDYAYFTTPPRELQTLADPP